MKPTKILQVLIAICFTVFIAPLKAQNSYILIGAGYALGTSNYPSGQELTYNSSGSNNYSKSKILNSGLGQGFNFEAGYGHMFTNNIGMELGIGYFKSNKVILYNSAYIYTNFTDKQIAEWQNSSFQFITTFKIAGELGKIHPYTKFGFIIGIINKATIYDNGESVSGNSISKSIIEEETTGQISLGFTGSAGITLSLSEKMKFFIECNLQSQSFTPSKSVITKSIEDGINNLASLTTYQKETTFSKEVTYDSNNINLNEPKKNLAISIPVNNIGIHVGIHIGLHY